MNIVVLAEWEVPTFDSKDVGSNPAARHGKMYVGKTSNGEEKHLSNS